MRKCFSRYYFVPKSALRSIQYHKLHSSVHGVPFNYAKKQIIDCIGFCTSNTHVHITKKMHLTFSPNKLNYLTCFDFILLHTRFSLYNVACFSERHPVPDFWFSLSKLGFSVYGVDRHNSWLTDTWPFNVEQWSTVRNV